MHIPPYPTIYNKGIPGGFQTGGALFTVHGIEVNKEVGFPFIRNQGGKKGGFGTDAGTKVITIIHHSVGRDIRQEDIAAKADGTRIPALGIIQDLTLEHQLSGWLVAGNADPFLEISTEWMSQRLVVMGVIGYGITV